MRFEITDKLTLRSLNSQSIIMDVAADFATPVAPDSHDAYAGTLPQPCGSLLARSVRERVVASGNLAAPEEGMRDSNLLHSGVKPGTVWSGPSSFRNPNDIGYHLMDSMRGLRGPAARFRPVPD